MSGGKFLESPQLCQHIYVLLFASTEGSTLCLIGTGSSAFEYPSILSLFPYSKVDVKSYAFLSMSVSIARRAESMLLSCGAVVNFVGTFYLVHNTRIFSRKHQGNRSNLDIMVVHGKCMRITYGCVRLLAFRIRGAAIRINPEEIDRIHESAIIVDVACQINPIPCDHVGRTNSIQVVDVDIVAKPVTLNAEDPRLAHCTSAHSRACRAVVVKE